MSSDKLESFPIRFTGKNYCALEFQFKLFVKGKELWGHIDGSNPALRDAKALSKWEIKDARVMTWILSLVEPHLVLNPRPYKTVVAMWNYLHTVYNQDNSTRRFQLEYEMVNFTRESLSIEEYFSGFQTLWIDYSDIVYANVPVAALSAVQAVHATNKRDQFLMKLRPDFEIAQSNLMNRHPVPSLDACSSELLREEQRIVTQATMEHRANVSAPVFVAYAAQGQNKGRDMRKQGHIISVCPIRPERKQGIAYHASTGASSSAALLAASSIVPIPALPEHTHS
ncbi:hypothetical protein CK203_026814 [Vitis vinifera]|uniref:Retrotransposon gag domain-containing protein n=1 Tax=Vitis vinifera TaxID=29760 RepID=A0A438IPB4_VITVI|nr:hypothetical protein CK203_026814 [Vitis vinifera]